MKKELNNQNLNSYEQSIENSIDINSSKKVEASLEKKVLNAFEEARKHGGSRAGAGRPKRDDYEPTLITLAKPAKAKLKKLAKEKHTSMGLIVEELLNHY